MLRASLPAIGAFVASLACLAGPAVASTASISYIDPCAPDDLECKAPSPPPIVGYAAAAGESNALELSFADGVVTLRDPGAAVSAESGCTSVSEHEAACRTGGGPQFSIGLGDLADTFSIVGAYILPTAIGGGDGDDVITGGPGHDSVAGGAGDDRVSGGDDADSLTGGEGRDSIEGGAGDDILLAAETVAAVDVYDGGEGRDAVSFDGRRRSVSATPAGAEGDTFTGVEDLVGGAGDDRLTGDDGAKLAHGRARCRPA